MEHWYLIDYATVKSRDRQDVRVTKAMCGANCWTDHHLVLSKVNLRVLPKRRTQGMKLPKRLNIDKLKIFNVQQSFANTLEGRLDSTTSDTHDADAARDTLRETVYNTAIECSVPSTRNTKTGPMRTSAK